MDAVEELGPERLGEGAVQYDVALCVQVMTSPRAAIRGRGHGEPAARAGDVVICPLLEAEGMFGVKTLACGEAGDRGADGAVAGVDCGLHRGWEGVSVRWRTRNMGGVGRGGVVG